MSSLVFLPAALCWWAKKNNNNNNNNTDHASVHSNRLCLLCVQCGLKYGFLIQICRFSGQMLEF